MKKKWIVLIVIIAVIIIIACFYHYGFYYFDFDKAISKSSELLKLLFSFITFIIALKIYDRFGVNRKIAERRTELILELITELKKLEFRASKLTGDNLFEIGFYASKDMGKYLEMREQKTNAKVAFYFPEKMNDINITKNILRLIKNPLMPETISKTLEFLESFGGTAIRKEDDIVKIYFSELGNNNINKTEGWIIDNRNDCTLDEFVNKFKLSFLEIESWVTENSTLNEKLNI